MMKKIFFCWMVLSLCVTADGLAATASSTDEQTVTIDDANQTFEQGAKAYKNNISVVNLSGSWFQMGRQYGMLMKEELGDVYQFIRDLIDNHIVNPELVEAVVDKEEQQTPFRILQFMRGASETSGLTMRQLQMTNAVERICGLPQCSAAFCWGEYADGPLVIGRNYDYNSMFSMLKNDVAVTVYHPADGALSVATIGYVGEIYAVNALNEKGIFLELNNGSPAAPISSPNARYTGTTMLFSELFETDDLADWDLFFHTVNCSSSYIINMADSYRGVSYEWCPIDVKHGEYTLPDGLMVSTNFFVNPDWIFKTPSDAACWNGITRRNNLITLCENFKGTIDEQRMKQIVETPMAKGGAMNDMTVYQMVVTPETKTLRLRVTGGLGWLKVDLNGFLNGVPSDVVQLKADQPRALTIRRDKGRQVRLIFSQAPKKTLDFMVYSLSGTVLSQQSLQPTGATTYMVEVPQVQSGAHIVRVKSPEVGLTGSEIICW